MPSAVPPESDASNGYEEFASAFIAARNPSMGIDVVREWARNLPRGGAVLDLGCGTGVPISQWLIEDGFVVYGVDASPTLADECARRFPQVGVACEPVETSRFFGRSFDGVVPIGLMFLLSADTQRSLISKVTSALNPGGQFLFTAPYQVSEWEDLITGRQSRSHGEDAYATLLSKAALAVVGNYTGEGGTYYFHARRQN